MTLDSVAALGAERDAALAADDVPSLARAAAKLREQRALYRTAVQAIEAMCTVVNEALADRLLADVENAERRATDFPLEYVGFAGELARDDPRFEHLAHRVAAAYLQLHGTPPSGATGDLGEEGD